MTKFAMSAVKCWSMVKKTCCTLLVEQHTKPVHAGNSFVHCVHIYIFLFICIYVRMRISVLQMEGQLHGDERWGRICQFQAGLETGSGDGGGLQRYSKWQHPLPPPPLSASAEPITRQRGGEEAGLWCGWRGRSLMRTQTLIHTRRQEVWCSPVVIKGKDGMSNKTTEVMH